MHQKNKNINIDIEHNNHNLHCSLQSNAWIDAENNDNNRIIKTKIKEVKWDSTSISLS